MPYPNQQRGRLFGNPMQPPMAQAMPMQTPASMPPPVSMNQQVMRPMPPNPMQNMPTQAPQAPMMPMQRQMPPMPPPAPMDMNPRAQALQNAMDLKNNNGKIPYGRGQPPQQGALNKQYNKY